MYIKKTLQKFLKMSPKERDSCDKKAQTVSITSFTVFATNEFLKLFVAWILCNFSAKSTTEKDNNVSKHSEIVKNVDQTNGRLVPKVS